MTSEERPQLVERIDMVKSKIAQSRGFRGRMGLSLIACLIGWTSCTQAETYLRLAEVPEDSAYWLQGEYLGAFEQGATKRTVGAQVSTSGEGQFRLLIYQGGLPGNGWIGGSAVDAYTAKLEGKRLLFAAGDHLKFLVEDRRMTVMRPSEGSTVLKGVLERVVRDSPTLGLAPPPEATVLFDGSGLDSWRDTAAITEDSLLVQGASTREAFGDLFIHIEYLLPVWPAGTANSGVYVQNRYEVQIYGSYGMWPVGVHHDGALYNFRKPDVKATRPPLQWQTFDILFRAPRFDEAGRKTDHARISVLHNGSLVHHDVELPGGTGAGANRPEVARAELHLQRHSGPGFFRNVWVIKDAQAWPDLIAQRLAP
jgi:hypothetical protein